MWITGRYSVADALLAAAVVAALIPLGVDVAHDLRRGKTGVDLIALLAMAGALALHQFLAGAVIRLMMSGGQSLERYAGHRARRELTALLQNAPHIVHRYEGGRLTSPPIAEVQPGDLLLVKEGEIVPVDGVVAGSAAVMDEAAITGETRPVRKQSGDHVRSGALNAGPSFDMRAVSSADQSTYAGIVRLVRDAEASKSHFVRIADRYAMLFLLVTLVFAGGAWLISGDPVRALAVLVVATPCPLILAAPVAIVAGISRAASRGVIVKGGAALETLGRATILIFDKTGTLTVGAPHVAGVESFGALSADTVLQLAASLDQVSPHAFADAIVGAARHRGQELEFPTGVHEQAGTGIEGLVGGRTVGVGQAQWLAGDEELPASVIATRRRASMEGLSIAFVVVDGGFAGAITIDDPLRPDSAASVQALRAAGVQRLIVLSGDRREVADGVAASLGADASLSERSPAEKVKAVLDERRRGITVMVGDGVNDAPALAAADVGIAMGARGATASSEAADAVITVDRLDRVAEAIMIAKRARALALQSVVAGMALSALAMILASAGVLPPVGGAVFQEVIDVGVVLNALRGLGGQAPVALSQPRGAIRPWPVHDVGSTLGSEKPI